MPRVLQNLQVPLDQSLEENLAWLMPEHGDYRILRQSVDARQRHKPHFVYTVEVAEKGERLSQYEFNLDQVPPSSSREKVLIVGSGPAGLFAALRLVERGIPCILFERGSQAQERIKGINKYWRYGELDPRNNVCFGEGGAGLYSDGKLITRIKSPFISYVMNRLVKFGAPAEIEYMSNPHVGSDRLRRVIPFLRNFLLENGCEIRFDSRVVDLLIENKKVVGLKIEQGESFHSPHVILATGHSASDIFEMLARHEVFMEGKSIAIGLRVEHSQKWVNQTQYRDAAENPKLGSANYKLTHHDEKSGIGVYSFCMCPGGFVLSSSTEADGLVCNGMSNYNRNSPWANSAVVVTMDHEKHFGGDVFGGLKWRRDLEVKAYDSVLKAGGKKQLPAQNLNDFISGKLGEVRKGSSPSGEIATRLDLLLPDFLKNRLVEGFDKFDLKMKGFRRDDAQVYGVESRTSCPVRVTRDEETLQSLSHPGLYPVGEGAGYAGGITSAACDGIKVADKIFELYRSQALSSNSN
jgi:uncharacterized protein